VACEAACDLLQPTLLSRVIDEGIAQGRMDLVLADAGLMLVFTLVGACFALGRNSMASRVSQAAATRIRSDLYRRILARQVDEASSQSPDTLLTRLTNDVTQVQNFLNGSMRIFFKAPILAAGALVMAFLLDPGLALVLAVVIPVVGVLVVATVGRGLALFQGVQRGLDRVNAAFREFLSGIRVVKAFDRGGDEVRRFSEAAGNLAEANIAALMVLARVGPVVGLAVNLGLVVVLALGFPSPGRPFLPGHLVAFVNYMTQILFALLMAANILNALVRARASAGRIDEVLEAPLHRGTFTPVQTSPVPVGQGLEVRWSRTAYRYPGSAGPGVLEEIDAVLHPGEFVGVLGATGSGKSTLLGLVCGFYEPTSGEVLVGGTPVYGTAGALVRPRIGLVPQKVNLFTGTIRSNLAWGRPDAPDADLEAAARASGAWEFIQRFPEGWHTPVGRGGVTLSGGQKQRLSLARALVRRPDLLLLDDTTSAVDPVTEAAIRANLRALPGRPTVVLVAQKAASVADADRILVLDDGRIAGFGSYRTLVRDCPVFQQILASQTGLEADRA
jgi:ATP-binding cassette subfamily B multidrug efflux pump